MASKLFSTELRIAGEIPLHITSPLQAVILRHTKLEHNVSTSWRREIDLNGSLDYMSEVEQELQSALYPVVPGTRIWVEDLDGNTIDGVKESVPPTRFAKIRWKGTRITDKNIGRVEERFPSGKPVFTHLIQIGWEADGTPAREEIEARDWPPALFFVRSNEARAWPIRSLAESSISNLMTEIGEVVPEFYLYEHAGYFYAPAAPLR